MKKRDWRVALISAGITLGVVVVMALILHLCSFQIVYDPRVITNWDSVAAVAAWAGVLVSIIAAGISALAIYYAILVPKIISERQDKIAMFEKRLTCYSEIQEIIGCSELVKDSTSSDDIFIAFCSVFGCLESESALQAIKQLVQVFNVKQLVVASGKFIFSTYDAEQAQDLFHAAAELLESLTFSPVDRLNKVFPEEIQEKRDIFCKKCDEFEREYMDIMEADLNLR